MFNQNLLIVNNLHTWFELRRLGFIRVGFVRAVNGVSFYLKKGESIALVGESGCGKSTLARTILGLHQPIRGKILFQGESLTEMGRLQRQHYHSQVGYVQQDPYGALPPFMNIYRILEEPLLIHRIKSRVEREDLIRQVLSELKLVPVEDFLNKFPHMLSGGQQQRVVIARAMILDPQLIIADEPVSMLDASVRVEILQIFRQLQDSHNLGIIYVTHDLSTVRYFSERILVMYAAKIIEEAETEVLLKNPCHPYTQALLESIPDPDATNATTIRKVPSGEPPSLLNPPTGCRFQPRCSSRKKNLCELEEPPKLELESGHQVACWLYHKR